MSTRTHLLAAWACCLGLAWPAAAADSLWDGAGGLLPDEVLRPWALTDTADPEDPVLAAGVLTLETSENPETMGYVQSGAAVSPGDPWVIEFEMRFVSGVGVPQREPSMVFVTTAPDVGMLFVIGADTIALLSASATVGESVSVDTDSDFHVYRMEVFGDGSVDLYYDDVLTLQGQTYAAPSDHGSEVRVGWGNGSIASFGQSEWRSFTHNGAAEICGDGILDPGEECDDGNTTLVDGCDAECLVEVPEPTHALLLVTGALLLLGAHRFRTRRTGAHH